VAQFSRAYTYFTITFNSFMLWCPFLARVYSRILAKMCAVAMTTGLVKNKALKTVFVYLKSSR